ncbi:MAG: hypothetical protein NZ552_07505 [Planctomycetes bacterium]|nr:hypothetical protein [Planctomycetota bacterium]
MRALLALARLTAADVLRQPATWLALAVGGILLGLSLVFGMFNFAEADRMRMLCSSGIAVHAVVALFIGVLGASTAVHRELAERTALTLLAKPLSRVAFLAGKGLGLLGAVALCGLLLALAHAGVVEVGAVTAFEFDHDPHHHHGEREPIAVPWGSLLGGHALAAAQALCMTALAVVLALRFALVGNIIACFAAWVIAHLLPQLGWHGAFVIPALDLLVADDAAHVAGGLPLTAVLAGLAHALAWCAGAMAIGLALFQQQDIP